MNQALDLLSAYLKAHKAFVIDLLGLLIDYGKARKDAEKTVPYHLNVIDELHINENAHSRILHKMLSYQNPEGDYPILQSLIDRLAEKNPTFKRIKIDLPYITQETERIDLWVRDKTYTLIFENKVYNAQDQEAQLARYIEKSITTNHYGHEKEDIFVVYMPQRPGEPSNQSWGPYQDSFKERYVSFSFMDGILPWLIEKVISSSNIGYSTKDQIFHTAIKQYIDYLEGLFSQRNYMEGMSTTLEKLITDKLQLSECKDDFEKFEKLSEQYDECSNLRNKLWEMRQNAVKKHWHDCPVDKFPNIQISTKSSYVGVIIPTNEGNVYVHIDEDGTAVYCQAEFEESRPIEGSIVMKLKTDKLLNQSNTTCSWTYFQKNPTHDVFDCFVNVINWLISHNH